MVLAVVALAVGGTFYMFSDQPTTFLGRPAPLFALPAATGGTISLAEFQGKRPVVLVFYMHAG